MNYTTTIWRKSDRERAAAMIQAIKKQIKSRRIIRSLERFVGGRPYGGDLAATKDHMIYHLLSSSLKGPSSTSDDTYVFTMTMKSSEANIKQALG
ncbi:hypothetical protein Tco_0167782, partial [Tanacetum coccineum]